MRNANKTQIRTLTYFVSVCTEVTICRAIYLFRILKPVAIDPALCLFQKQKFRDSQKFKYNMKLYLPAKTLVTHQPLVPVFSSTATQMNSSAKAS